MSEPARRSNNGRFPIPARCLLLIGLAALTWFVTPLPSLASGPSPAEIRLGARLFSDDRFSSPKGDLVTGCSHCHIYEPDAQRARLFTDSFSRSWVPWRPQDPRREGLRNAPTLLDVAGLSRLHFDGEFGSLEDLVRGTISGRTFGWLPGEEEQAWRNLVGVIRDDAPEQGTSYRELFRQAYGVDLRKLDQADIGGMVARSIAAYVRTLRSTRTSAYDRFIERNGGFELALRWAQWQDGGILKLTPEFGSDAVEGMRIFFRAAGGVRAGNCAVCHAPPLFTDAAFHNLGVTQEEYDSVHGTGSFAALEIPGAGQAMRPSPRFRETPSRDKPGFVDLGYWNFVRLRDAERPSPAENSAASDDELLRRLIATFKTPTLRNLAYSQPYMHNGAYPTLESVLQQLIRASDLARSGHLRSADPELARIHLTEADIKPLIAFLNSLNDDLKQTSLPHTQ